MMTRARLAGGMAVWSLVAMVATAAAQEATATTTEASAEPEKSWSLEVGTDFSSNYLFRGVDLLGEGNIMWPHVAFGIGGFSAYYYGYFGDTPGTSNTYREADFGADYTFEIGKLSLTAGAVAYQYNSHAENDIGFLDTYELYVLGGFDVLLAPSFSYYQDMDVIEGGYASLGISHSFDLSDSVALALSGSVGFDFGYNLSEGWAEANDGKKSNGDLNDMLFGADLSWTVNDTFSVHGLVQRSVSLDALDTLGQPDFTIWTVGGAVTF